MYYYCIVHPVVIESLIVSRFPTKNNKLKLLISCVMVDSGYVGRRFEIFVCLGYTI